LLYSVVALFGPTASGKSEIAEALARRLATEVVSADALQVYDGLPILTNQPGTPTRLTAIRPLSAEMSVGEFAALAHEAIDDLVGTRGRAVVAGGTGLYFRAALADLRIPRAVSPATRARIEELYDADPLAAYTRLQSADPTAAGGIHVNERRRVVRALELAESGVSLSPEVDELWSRRVRHPTLVIGLDMPAGALERRIRARTASMIARGAVDEARAAMAGSISKTAANALGLRELTTLPVEEAEEALALRTRRYAAYQRKWMRRIPGIELVNADRPAEEIVDAILDLARTR
jgi:tRNA dimethylallyltransferase